MDSYVVKVQNGGTIRRLNLAPGEKQFSYEQFQNRVGNVFQLPASAKFVLTYIDKDGDVVTMAEDEDLQDALVVQKLNPLRVTIENLQVGTDDVKVSSPLVQNELKSDEVTEQQQQQEGIQGEQMPQSLSSAVQVDPVANAERVLNSSKNPAAPEEKVSTTIDGAPTGAAAVDASIESMPEEATITGYKFSVRVDNTKRHGRPQIHSGIRCDGCGMLPIVGPRFKSCKKPNYDLCLKCFEASGAEEKEYAKIDRLFYRIGYPAYVGRMRELQRAQEGMCRKPDERQKSTPDAGVKNSTAAAPAETENKPATEENSTRVVHPGVQCDECGMVPIEGPRYKSSARFNYDLCQSCFERSGNNTTEYSRIDQPVVVRRGRPFVMGKVMPPFLRQYPGRCVWVLNQMVPILAVDEAEAGEKTQAAGSDQAGPEEKTSAAGSDVKVPPPQAESAATENASSATSAPEVDSASVAQQEGNITEGKNVEVQADKAEVVDVPVIVNDGDSDSGTSSAPENRTPVDLEKREPSIENDTLYNAGKTAGVDEETVKAPAVAAGVREEIVQVSEGPADGDLTTKEGLLAKLAAMGFEDSKLNEELLEKNSFDLRKTLDDLCAAEEWDPILGELQEMGFYDANMNRRLMFKNNGSVKRVVKELVQIYKGEKLA